MVGEMEVESLLMSEGVEKAAGESQSVGMEGGDWETPTAGPIFLIATAYFTFLINPSALAWQPQALAARAAAKRYIFFRSLRISC